MAEELRMYQLYFQQTDSEGSAFSGWVLNASWRSYYSILDEQHKGWLDQAFQGR